MNEPSDTPPSKGMMMIAAYRAARLSQRPVFRSNLQQTHTARRMARAQGQVRAETAPPVPVDPPAGVSAEVSVPDAGDAGSVFANLFSIAVAERHAEPCVADAAPIVETKPEEGPAATAASTTEQDIAAPETIPDAVAEQVVPSADLAAADDPPLAEIGFGPGMLIRLSQLGVNTTGELAMANPAELRAALGEISRLVDVETWISNARQKSGPGRASTEP